MGRRGPPPTPTAVLKMRGSRRANNRAGEPAPPAEIPPRPAWLLPAAVEEWDRITPHLARLGILATIDLGVLATYCQCFAHWRAAEEWMQANGTVAVMRDDKGSIKWTAPVPQFAIAQKALEKMMRAAAELGLSAASRARLSVKPPGSEDTEEEQRIAAILGRPGKRKGA
jgi:P27 family predicted phage terminase small subunit